MALNIYGPFFTQEELGISDNTNQEIRKNLFLLTKFGLNPVRKKFGPVKITSGFRTLEHNIVVGGVDGSQHTTGEAVDFMCTAAPSRAVYDWLATWWPGQLIFYSIRGHVHIGLPTIALQVAGRLHSSINDTK